jgi:UDP-glucose 4-epimerase
MRILVTGGAGYIGSHTCIELLESGHEVFVIDNFCNSSPESLRRVQEITGKQLEWVPTDLLEKDNLLGDIRTHGPFDACIHFAALKAVGESVAHPLRYYRNNLTGTMNLLEALTEVGCTRLVFSSSATVYGDPEQVPVTEDARLDATNPYGRTKLYMEQMMSDLCVADQRWRCVLLRYFNPIGAHSSGRIGEDPKGIPNNLMPYIAQVAVGRREQLSVFGNDYPTPDGTGVRDYIHVVDLAKGHVAALAHFDQLSGSTAINLGTGCGYSVLQLVQAFERAVGKQIPYRTVDRRPGDVAELWAQPGLAKQLIGWQAKLDLDAMCVDTWRWQSGNPNGYEG